jgi:hypothetical protein
VRIFDRCEREIDGRRLLLLLLAAVSVFPGEIRNEEDQNDAECDAQADERPAQDEADKEERSRIENRISQKEREC